MIEELLLLSHGRAKRAGPGIETARPLTSRAKRQAQKLGAWMQGSGLAPDITLASPECPAMTSAEKALKAGGWTAAGIVAEPSLQHGLLTHPPMDHSVRRLLCAGHADRLSHLLSQLVPKAPPLPHGSLARVDLTGKRGRMAGVVLADDLPEGFPFPGPGGPERRRRPAYYYTQSAALPFRMRGNVLEVLLITSSSGQKWGIPKGICEPGLSPEASAAKEAEEEAGIRGDIAPRCLARYDQRKWGAVCDVSVYPMAVTEVLPESARQEPHRQRAWLSVEAAAARVSNPDLARIIAGFAAE